MNVLLKLEEAAVFLFCLFLFSQLNIAWWWFPALLFVPDIGMLGYVFSSRIGALTYNFVHHRLTASLVAFYAISCGDERWQVAALILFAHSSLDRVLGYGLKYNHGFNYTHLGTIGKKGDRAV